METLIQEVGARDFGLKRQERVTELRERDYQSYDSDANTYLTWEQAQRFAELAGRPVFDVDCDGSEEFYVVERVREEFPGVEVGFSGSLGERGYLDTVYFFVEDSLPGREREFKRFVELHFQDWLSVDPSENFGLDPNEHSGVVAFEQDEGMFYRDSDADSELWMCPSSINYWKYPEMGETVRLWWD